MKQKIVIKMSMHEDKCRSRALKIAVCMPGVESAAVVGEEKDQVEVVGDGIDSVELTRLLRKKMGHAVLLSVGEAGNEQPPSPVTATETVVAPPCFGYPQYHCYEVKEPTWDYPCTIL